MNKFLPLVFALLHWSSCKERPSVITIVDIGKNNRLEIGKLIRVLNQFSPKVIALDFHLVPDSLDRDSILVKELGLARNVVQVAGLHNFNERLDCWDSLEASHPKFRVTNYGFSNITTDEDTVLVNELPIEQKFQERTIYAFSYVVALNSFGVKSRYRERGTTVRPIHFDLEENFKVIANKDLVNGNFRKEDINDRIVLLGYLGNDEDYWKINEKGARINGVKIQAGIINELIDL